MTDESSLGAIQEATFARAASYTAASYPPESRLSAEQINRYLDQRAFAVVGSTRPDGRPHSVPTSYLRRGATLWMPVGKGSTRERNIRANPNVSVVVTEGDHDRHVAVIIEGTADVVDGDSAPTDVRAHMDGDWIESWVRLRAERVMSYASAGMVS
ncbi:MAG: pyridoxamine 5'-phosphate oxidase family protein [Acidimicrobiales bacterium]